MSEFDIQARIPFSTLFWVERKSPEALFRYSSGTVWHRRLKLCDFSINIPHNLKQFFKARFPLSS